MQFFILAVNLYYINTDFIYYIAYHINITFIYYNLMTLVYNGKAMFKPMPNQSVQYRKDFLALKYRQTF